MTTVVDIRLLGPVEVVGVSGIVPLGGQRLRTLVGLLALRAPDVVSRETLIEGIWDAHPPANAGKTLRAHVAYLRRRLVAGGLNGLITTRSPGYVLGASAESVDVHRFEDLVASGRSALAAGAVETSVEHLRAALRLWRGDVLAGCATGQWARAEATRLREVQLSANEELIAGELVLGRHARVVAELESLVAQHPLRERLWELLMRALHRAGRQGDALHAYQRARTKLIAELGVEPGPELQRLEAEILAGDTTSPGPAVVIPRPRADTAAVSETVPAPLTKLIGRRADINELSALLAERRLVTLTGVGGCGKTRLAIAVANEVAQRYADGVRFLDLSPVTDPNLVPAMVAAALGVPEDPADGLIGVLAQRLRPLSCLLVLDNCEHVVHSCARLVNTLLRSCPRLRVLATSRETLGVLGELAWPVQPLATPPSPPPGGLTEVRRYDAVRLFLDRATVSAVRGLTDADAPALADVCSQLDGLPLAIELAAARTAVLTVGEIAARLHDPTLLHADRPPERPHHRTLDATVAWSYELLDEATRSRFRRLAVFVGGFTLAAARAVCDEPSERAAVGMLADLVAKSLVVMERQPTGARYRLLETIGRWAADRLAECPHAEREARQRHAAHYLALAEEADQRLRGPETGCWLERLAAEHENLRAALTWFATGSPDPPAQLRMALALEGYCRLRGRYSEGRRWLEDALSQVTAVLPTVPPDVLPNVLPTSDDVLAGCGGAGTIVEAVGRALAAIARFALLVGDYDEAQAKAQQALCAQRQSGDASGAARTLRLLASVARERGEYERSLSELDEALATPCDRTAVADVLQLTGFTSWLAGDLDWAERALSAALQRYRRLGDPGSVAFTRTHLAAVALYRGQLDRARWLAGESLAGFTELDFQEGIAWAFNILGLVALRQGRCEPAVDALRASLVVHSAVGDRWRQASVLDALAATFLMAGDPIRSAELVGLAETIRDTLGVPVPAQERPAWEHTRTSLRRLLPADQRAAALARGSTMRVVDLLDSLELPEPLSMS